MLERQIDSLQQSLRPDGEQTLDFRDSFCELQSQVESLKNQMDNASERVAELEANAEKWNWQWRHWQ